VDSLKGAHQTLLVCSRPTVRAKDNRQQVGQARLQENTDDQHEADVDIGQPKAKSVDFIDVYGSELR